MYEYIQCDKMLYVIFFSIHDSKRHTVINSHGSTYPQMKRSNPTIPRNVDFTKMSVSLNIPSPYLFVTQQ